MNPQLIWSYSFCYRLALIIGLITIWLPLTNPIKAQTPAQCDTVYAVYDQGVYNSQFFTYHLTKHTLDPLGQLHLAYDIEGLSVHPQTHVLYATSGQFNALLYTVDGKTGALSLVGDIGFDNVVALAFHPDGSLWGWSDQGLLQIDTDSGMGTLISPKILPIQGITWNHEGTKLYAVADDSANASTLWVYDNTDWQVACEGLPKKVEGLETQPDGLLVYGFHQDTSLGIHTYEVSTCQTRAESQIDTPYNDIEGIAWSTHSCTLSNLEALRAYLENLEGYQSVVIEADGAISVTLHDQIHKAQLAEQVTAGTPPPDGQLHLNPIDDSNGDGIDDFEVIYPSGDRQIVYYFGTETEPQPEACQNIIAPPLDPTVITIPALSTEFLYTGTNPIQTGVIPGTINLEQAAILRGKVITQAGKPLPNVTITIKDHPEFGQTLTTCDGTFNMVVNGGGQLTINYQKENFLPIQRQIQSAWQQYSWADDVAMIALDPQVTEIDLSANIPIQVAQGSLVTDAEGSRQATILFPQDTSATMILPDGSTQPLVKLDVRATEYTVGKNGPKAMPAPLPPTSAYTYAVELSVDQATAVGATRVEFSQPVFLYVDNFLDFPVGGVVPIGWYDRNRAVWVPSDNGRIIKILRIENGLAVLDIDGSGQAANETALAELGITEAERQQLAILYTRIKVSGDLLSLTLLLGIVIGLMDRRKMLKDHQEMSLKHRMKIYLMILVNNQVVLLKQKAKF